MAEMQNPVAIPAEKTAPVTAQADAFVEDSKAQEETAAAITQSAVDTKPAETNEPAAPTVEASTAVAETTAAPTEEVKEEVKSVEEGFLEYKGQGTNFPKNLIFSKKYFWFGVDAVDLRVALSFKADKNADVAHHVAAWASETGKGLLFLGEKDKSAMQSAILLAEATEPITEGTHKFHITAKGNKHSFKAFSTTERENWISQLKTKIAEAKELAATIVESETYKKTLESLKPAAAKKEEKAASAEPAPVVPATTEEQVPTTEAGVAEAPAETAKEEGKKEDSKRRSASRKRASVFGTIFSGNKKEEEKKSVEPAKGEDKTPAAESATAAPAATEEQAPTTEVATAETTTEIAKDDDKKEEAPKPIKRQSIFGNLSFNRKKAVESDAAPKEAMSAPTEAVAESAPVIPAVQSTEPLSAEVTAPVIVPTETTDVSPAANGEAKKEAVRNDKRKSSLPFAFGGKKDKATSDEEGEKVKSPGPFSKLRATIKGNKGKASTDKAGDKSEDTPSHPADPAAAESSTEAAVKEEAKPAQATELSNPIPPTEGTSTKVENTPVVTAAA